MVRMLTAAAALTIAGSAIAVPQGAFWVEVDNGGIMDSFGPPFGDGDLTGTRTFDLFVQLEAGDTVTAADFGVAGPNSGLNTTQNIWNHPNADSDLIQTPTPGFTETLEFDTALRLGDLDGEAGAISVQSIDFSNPAALTAVWNANAPGGFPFASPDGGNAMHLLRITVDSAGPAFAETGDFEFLGGQVFVSGDGPNGTFGREIAANGVVNVDNAFPVPTPGAVALFGLAGAAATRRRR